jgi:hypothetical protein
VKKKTVAEACNKNLDLVRQFAPSLVVARASLLPFEDVIECEEAGPQQGEDVPPYFAVMIRDSEFVRAEVTADKVRIEVLDESLDVLDEWDTTLRGLWDYMRQVQRPASSFRRR